MTGPEHYREAERLLGQASAVDLDGAAYFLGDNSDSRADVAAAQVHATLALAAATAYPAIKDYTGDEMGHESRGWANVTAPRQPVSS